MSRRVWTCPRCQRAFRIPAAAADPDACPDCRSRPQAAVQDSTRLRAFFAAWPWVLLFGSGYGAAETWFSPPGLDWLIGQLCVVGVFAAIGAFVRRRWPTLSPRIVVPAAALVAVTACVFYGKSARYYVFWESESGVRYADTYDRDRVMRYRRVSFYDDGRWTGWAEGEFAGSGVPHGAWRRVSYHGVKRDESTDWYWYGETITEGEWHLRNR